VLVGEGEGRRVTDALPLPLCKGEPLCAGLPVAQAVGVLVPTPGLAVAAPVAVFTLTDAVGEAFAE
jgi:hypothetical protein